MRSLRTTARAIRRPSRHSAGVPCATCELFPACNFGPEEQGAWRRWGIMNIWTAIRDPLQGKTSLSKVVWLYGLGGSLLVSALGLLLPDSEFARRSYVVFGLLFSVYVTVATYLCAGNCRSKALARFVRFCAVLSLVLLPVLAYLDLTGALDLALTGLQGEQ